MKIGLFNLQGMKTEESYFGINNEPILDRNGLYHKQITQYEAKGKIVKRGLINLLYSFSLTK